MQSKGDNSGEKVKIQKFTIKTSNRIYIFYFLFYVMVWKQFWDTITPVLSDLSRIFQKGSLKIKIT